MIAISVPFLLSHNQVQDDTRYLSCSDYIFELEMALSPFFTLLKEGSFFFPFTFIYADGSLPPSTGLKTQLLFKV